MATVYWKDKHPNLWTRLYGPGGITALSDLEPFEIHIPVDAETLLQWRVELPFHGNSQYGQILKRDIGLAEKCNARGCEMIVSLREEAVTA